MADSDLLNGSLQGSTFGKACVSLDVQAGNTWNQEGNLSVFLVAFLS